MKMFSNPKEGNQDSLNQMLACMHPHLFTVRVNSIKHLDFRHCLFFEITFSEILTLIEISSFYIFTAQSGVFTGTKLSLVWIELLGD